MSRDMSPCTVVDLQRFRRWLRLTSKLTTQPDSTLRRHNSWLCYDMYTAAAAAAVSSSFGSMQHVFRLAFRTSLNCLLCSPHDCTPCLSCRRWSLTGGHHPCVWSVLSCEVKMTAEVPPVILTSEGLQCWESCLPSDMRRTSKAARITLTDLASLRYAQEWNHVLKNGGTNSLSSPSSRPLPLSLPLSSPLLLPSSLL